MLKSIIRISCNKISRKIPTKPLYVICFFIILVTSPTAVLSQNVTNDSPCNCVGFRYDDVQDNYHEPAQVAVMNLFISKNQPLSLGLVMKKTDNNTEIVNKVEEGYRDGLFELDVHGWDHIDYTYLNETDQEKLLLQAKEKMQNLFGISPLVFIPPYDKFNNYTLEAITNLHFRIISSYEDKDKIHYSTSQTGQKNNANYILYHLPASTTFMGEYKNGTWFKVPLIQIIYKANVELGKYGYAVILLHPPNFIKVENGKYTNTLDSEQIADLSKLIDYFTSKNIPITTFDKVVNLQSQMFNDSHNLEQQSPIMSVKYSKTVPEFPSIILPVLTISLLTMILFTRNLKTSK